MSSSTAKFAIPYPVAGDPVNQEPVVFAAQSQRLDLLLGEGNTYNIASVAANTVHSQVVALGRTYPGNGSGAAGAGNVPQGTLLVQVPGGIASGVNFQWYVNTWTGTGATVTGFTLNTIWSAAQTNRLIQWRFLPVL